MVCTLKSLTTLVVSGTTRLFFGSGLVLLLLVFSGTLAQLPCTPSILSDTLVLKEIGIKIDSTFNHGIDEYRICFRGSNSLKLVLFFNGTEIEELDSGFTRYLIRRYPGTLSFADSTNERDSMHSKKQSPENLKSQKVTFAEKLSAFSKHGNWPTGLQIGNRYEIAGSKTIVWHNVVSASLMTKLFILYAGAEYQLNSYYGQLAWFLRQDSLNNFKNNTFSITAGLPFVRYELKQATHMLPDYVWLEPDILKLVLAGKEGMALSKIDRRWEATHLSNMSHLIHIHIGHLFLDFAFDQEHYKYPVTTIKADYLPSLFGTWGFSLTKATDTWIPGMWLQSPPVKTTMLSFGNYTIPFQLDPIRITFNYWDPHRYRFECTSTVNFDFQKVHPESL